jgi:hypothetical protein
MVTPRRILNLDLVRVPDERGAAQPQRTEERQSAGDNQVEHRKARRRQLRNFLLTRIVRHSPSTGDPDVGTVMSVPVRIWMRSNGPESGAKFGPDPSFIRWALEFNVVREHL